MTAHTHHGDERDGGHADPRQTAAASDAPPQQDEQRLAALAERERELERREQEAVRLWNQAEHFLDRLRYREQNLAYQAIVVHLLGLVPLEPQAWLRPLWHLPDREVLVQQQIAALDQVIPWLERYRAALRELREART
jgi:hypothetical protein